MTQIFHRTLVHGDPHCLNVKFQKILLQSISGNKRQSWLLSPFDTHNVLILKAGVVSQISQHMATVGCDVIMSPCSFSRLPHHASCPQLLSGAGWEIYRLDLREVTSALTRNLTTHSHRHCVIGTGRGEEEEEEEEEVVVGEIPLSHETSVNLKVTFTAVPPLAALSFLSESALFAAAPTQHTVQPQQQHSHVQTSSTASLHGNMLTGLRYKRRNVAAFKRTEHKHSDSLTFLTFTTFTLWRHFTVK